jgi:hypothetical protein
MKKVSKYFNEIMLIGLIAFIPLSMMSCSADDISYEARTRIIKGEMNCEALQIGKYEYFNNSNIIWYFGVNGELIKIQDGIQFFSGTYSQDNCTLTTINEFNQVEVFTIQPTISGIQLNDFVLIYKG